MLPQQLSSDDPARAEPLRVFVEFSRRPVLDREGTKEAGHNVFVDVDWMKWIKKGASGLSNEDAVETVRRTNPRLWEVAEAPYRAWQAGQEAPVDGTPLAMWPLVTPAQVATFQAMNIRTIEDVEGLTDADLDGCPPGTRSLRDKAKAWRESAANLGKSAEAIAALNQENRLLKNDLEETKIALREMREQLKEMNDDDTSKPVSRGGAKGKRPGGRGESVGQGGAGAG